MKLKRHSLANARTCTLQHGVDPFVQKFINSSQRNGYKVQLELLLPSETVSFKPERAL